MQKYKILLYTKRYIVIFVNNIEATESVIAEIFVVYHYNSLNIKYCFSNNQNTMLMAKNESSRQWDKKT